jgi:hypothetical protein
LIGSASGPAHYARARHPKASDRPRTGEGNAGTRRGNRDKKADDEWRAYLDIDDDLIVFCPECAEREFGWARLVRLG